MGKNNEQRCYKMRKHGSGERVTLEKAEIERDLGVQVDKDLRFLHYIETQVNKANRLLGPKRKSFEHLDAESMKLLFVALIQPHLEFGNVVWSPRLEKDKKLVEEVQRRATKIIPGLKDLTYEQTLEKTKLPSMCHRRLRGDLIEVFKYTQYLQSE